MSKPPETPTPRVLLVDDHHDTVVITARLLRRAGFEVRTAESAGEALELARQDPPQVVVSDIGLPDASGYDLMQQLRDQHQLVGVAVSGYAAAEDIRRSNEAGFNELVVKPVQIPELAAAIRRALQAPGR